MHLTRSSFLRRSTFLALAVAVIGGCTDFSTPPESLGRLFVNAKDETGAGVSGINFTLLLNDRATQWAKVITSANGTGEFRPDDGGVAVRGIQRDLSLPCGVGVARDELQLGPVRQGVASDVEALTSMADILQDSVIGGFGSAGPEEQCKGPGY